MVTQDDGIDLAGEKVEISAESEKPISVKLETQTHSQRQWAFWVVLGVAVILYIAFFAAMFCSERFRCFVAITPFAISIAVALLVLPSLLLWSIVRAVYRSSDKTEGAQSDAFVVTEKTLSMLEKAHKLLH